MAQEERKKEIDFKSKEFSSGALAGFMAPSYGRICELSYQAGATWADEHPRKGLVEIDKAVEWLNENLTNNPSGKLCASNYGVVTKKLLIDEFKKAMVE